MVILRSWRQQIKQRWVTVLVGTIILMIAVVLIIIGYKLDWTGFNGNSKSGKTLWDWLQLLIIPLALAIIAIFFNRAERKNEQRIASDNQQEAGLQAYINEMSLLLLEKHLRESKEGDEVRTIARVRTLTILPRLDGTRKGSIVQFLQESRLIEKENNIINLYGANLREANLREFNLDTANLFGADLSGADLHHARLSGANLNGANLHRADLSKAYVSNAHLHEAKLIEADLSEANLVGADLSRANLCRANLRGADLKEVDLYGTYLSEADLSGAKISEQQLDATFSLTNATMPDGSKRP